MRIARDVLQRFTDLPTDNRQLRLLLDDVGIEVKRVESGEGPLAFTVELLANRGDHHCYEGIAREVVGRTGLPLRSVPVASLDTSVGNWPLERQTSLLITYTATVMVRSGPPGSLSEEQNRPLLASGQQSISAPVDATNLANLELGQPTHVFDADKISGAIVIRQSRAGEEAWPLFTEGHIPLPEGTLVIADDKKILAIAGVIGCEDSKATAESTRIIVESATFDPVAVRKASRSLGIFTDSSARFERGADPDRALAGAGRVVYLLESAGWVREGGTSQVGRWTDPKRTIRLSTQATNAFLHTELTREQIADILDRYGFRTAFDGEDIDATVPSWRIWDVEYPADLYEELAKSIGYNETPVALPTVGLGAIESPEAIRRRQVDDVMVGNGFYEVLVDSFYGQWVRENLGLDESHPLWAHVSTANSLEKGYSLLKNNALAQAVAAIASNSRMRVDDVKLYEWTRTFHPVKVPDGEKSRPPCLERPILWAIASGAERPGAWSGRRDVDPLFFKGLVTELGIEFGLGLTVVPPNPSDPLGGLLHPGRQATVALDGSPVGILGEVHPSVLKRFKIKRARPVYMEIRAKALLAQGTLPAFVEPGTTHPIERNLAFSLPNGVEAQSVSAVLHSAATWLTRVRIVDRFDHTTEDGSPRRAITFALTFDNTKQDRSADEINRALEQLAEAVIAQFGPAGVVQR